MGSIVNYGGERRIWRGMGEWIGEESIGIGGVVGVLELSPSLGLGLFNKGVFKLVLTIFG